MSAYNDPAEAFPGLRYGLKFRDESFVVKEANGILPGYPVFGYVGDEHAAYLYHQDQDKVVFDADFVTDNNINGTVNGEAITEVPFNTDHDTTMDDLVAAIEALGYIAALDPDDVNNRTIFVTTKGEDAITTFVVTDGASQAVATITSQNSDILKYLGISCSEQKEYSGNSVWAQNDIIPVVAQGKVHAVTGETVQANTPAYVRTDGTFGTSGFTTSSVFRENKTGAGFAITYVGGANG